MAFGKLLSDRVKKRKGSELDSERYDYISLDNAEPDFGNPSSANGLMSSTQYGNRRFISTGQGLVIDSDNANILLTETGVNAGSYGTPTTIPDFQVDPYGRLTSAGETPLTLDNFTTDNLNEGSTNLYYTDTRVRSALSAAGDLSYDSATGVFSFDVEQVYTKANFDSDFNMAIDEASLGGVGLAYDAITNTLSIDSAELENYFKGDIRGYFSADKGLVYNSSTGNFDIDSANIRTLFSGGTGITYTPATGVYDITNTGVIADTYGSASQVPVLKINAQGQIDSAGTVTVAGVSSVVFDSASFNYTINTADGGVFTKMIHTRKPGLAAGEHGTASKIPIITVNEYGLVDSIGTTNVAGVTAFAWDSDTAQATITTADGGSFPATIRGYGHNVGLKFGGNNGHEILGKDATGGGLIVNTYGGAHRPIRFKILDNEKLRVSSLGIQVFNTNNTNVLETTAYGATVTGTINADSGTFDVVRPARLHTGLMTGPDTILIDPAAVGDATGTVRVLGNLIVEGTETTINSTVVSINDKAIVIADSAADSADLNGGGIIWGGSNIVDKPSFKYNHTNARFNANRPISADLIGNVTGTVSTLSNFTTDDLTEGASNEYYTKARVDSDIAASINDSDNVVNITINQTIGSVVDSAYVLARVEEAPFLDSDDLYRGVNNIKADSATFKQISLDSDDAELLFTGMGTVLGDKVEARFYRQGFQIHNGYLGFGDSSDSLDLFINSRKGSSTNQIINADKELSISQTANDKDITFFNDNGSGGTTTYLKLDGSEGKVRLYHYGSEKLNTDQYGVVVTGRLEADSAEISRAMVGTPNIDDSDYLFAVSDIDSGGKKFAILAPGGVIPNFTMKGEGEQTFRFHNTNTDPSSTKRVSFKMANRSNEDWEFIMFTDVAANGEESLKIMGRNPKNNLLIKDGRIRTTGALTADSAELVNLTLTGNVTGLRADSATIDNMVGTATNSAKLNNEGPAYYLAYENFTGIPFVFDSNQTVEIVDSNLSFNGFALRDAVRGAFGTDRDLEIYHDNADAYIDNDKGHLYIRNNVDDDDGGNIILQAKSGENGIVIADDAAVRLYHNAQEKLATTSVGVDITGTLNTHTIPGGTGTLALTSDLNFIDSAMALAFLSTLDSSDVSTIVSETVTNSFVDALNVDADTLDGVQGSSFLRSDTADAFSGVLTATAPIEFNGGVTYDPSSTGGGTDTATDVAISLASGQRIVGHNVGYIRTLLEWNVSGNLEIGQNNTSLINQTNIYGGNGANSNGGVNLYHAANKKLGTTDSGVEVTGAITADSANLQSIDLPERTVAGGAGEIRFGPQTPTRGMKLYNDGSSGIIECQESTLEIHGPLSVRDDLGNKIIATFSEFSGVILRDRSGNQTRLQTTVYGVDITGNLTTTDSAAIDGPLSVSGLTSTVGLFSNGVVANNQSAKGVYAGLSTGGDAQVALVGDNVDVYPQIDFSHDVNIDYDARIILDGAGNNAGNRLKIVSHGNESMAHFNADGAVELYHDNSKKFETTSAGATVTGNIRTRSAIFSMNAEDSSSFSTVVVGERNANDGLASLEFRNASNTFSSKIDGAGSYWGVWTNKNSENDYRIIANFGTADETIILKPNGTDRITANKYGATINGTMNADSSTIGNLNIRNGVIRATTGDLDLSMAVNQNFNVKTSGNTSAFNINNNNGKISLLNGTAVNEFSTDGTLAGNSDDAVPTEKAVKTYVDNNAGGDFDSADVLTVEGTASFTAVSGDFTSGNTTVNTLTLGSVIAPVKFQTSENSTSSANSSVLFNLNTGLHDAYKLLIKAKRGNDRQVSELLVTTDGTTAVATEYGVVTTNGILANYEVAMNSNSIQLSVTPTSANTTTYKALYTLLEA